MSDGRKNNRPVRPMPRALSDESVAAVDYMVHELGARQWKVGMKLGVSCVTNLAAGVSTEPLSHAEGEDTARKTRGRLVSLLGSGVRGVA